MVSEGIDILYTTSVGSTDDNEAVSTTASGCFFPSFTINLIDIYRVISNNNKQIAKTNISQANSRRMFQLRPSPLLRVRLHLVVASIEKLNCLYDLKI